MPDEKKNLISKYIKPLKKDIWRPVEEPTSWSQADDGEKRFLKHVPQKKAGNNEVVSIKRSSIV